MMHTELVHGRSFQAVGPETAKLRCPYVDVIVQGTIRSLCDAERYKSDRYENNGYGYEVNRYC